MKSGKRKGLSPLAISRITALGEYDWQRVVEEYRLARIAERKPPVSPLEQAYAVGYMLHVLGFSFEEVCGKFSVGLQWVRQRILLLGLEQDVLEFFGAPESEQDRLTVSDALVLKDAPKGHQFWWAHNLLSARKANNARVLRRKQAGKRMVASFS